MGTHWNCLTEAVLTSTHNLCFEQKYENYQNFSSESFHIWLVKFSMYVNRHVFIMKRKVENSPSVSSFLYSFLASGDFCRLLKTFANSLDPDQARQNVGPDLDPNCLTLWWYSWKIFLKKLILKKIHRQQKSMQNYPACKELSLSVAFCLPHSGSECELLHTSIFADI